jgi:hypothetical protein
VPHGAQADLIRVRRIDAPSARLNMGSELARLADMCLTCGCMQAHLEMGRNNITYEDVKAAADENGNTVAETLDIIERTVAKDRESHAQEYAR